MAETSKKQEEKAKEPLLSQEPSKQPSLPTPTKPSSPARALAFWAYFTISVSLLTFLLASLPSLRPPDHRSWFLSLPDDLRHHYYKGKLIKVHINPSRSPIQVFAVEHGPRDGEPVVLVHGLGCSSFSFRHVLRLLGSSGLHAVAIDLPGSGFSDKLDLREHGRWEGILGRIWDVYDEIKEKGLFWGFDQLVETGQVPYEEIVTRDSRRYGAESSGYGSAEMGRVVGQVIDSMALTPAHLVLHDSALGTGANWVSMNPGLVQSVTLIDPAAESVAFPSWMLGPPVLGELLLASRFAFSRLLRLCCSRSMDGLVAEAYRLLLKGRDGRKSVVAAGKALNYSFDLGEWAGTEVVKDMAFQVLWSNSWSDRWIDEGKRAASAIPRAKFASHSGGRWPQEDAAEEISEMIVQFVSSLPKSVKQKKEEPLPEHIQMMFDEASEGHHHHHHHGHGQEHATGYFDMYGLGQGWGV
ncbi:protein AUXIN RESPONSE 4 [Phoenix dactylifera]|uniref:Protein AUXIN RESPONSE 4 n=1 Tax=Phoenix dactylifera TaxID=42345 RepID=A0A8B7CLL8_PHODC|nr:protein AUXIN RESPONSE 4 [Phoenix dactylifera]